MSEEQNVETTEETQPTVEEAQQKTFTQEDVDRIVGERIKREREKYADYDDLKAKANASDETKSELEQLRERAESAERKANELEHANQLRAWAEQAASETGVPASVLRGSTLEELQEHARLIKDSMPVYPRVKDGTPSNAPTVSKESILAIQNEKERLKAIKENIDLF